MICCIPGRWRRVNEIFNGRASWICLGSSSARGKRWPRRRGASEPRSGVRGSSRPVPTASTRRAKTLEAVTEDFCSSCLSFGRDRAKSTIRRWLRCCVRSSNHTWGLGQEFVKERIGLITATYRQYHRGLCPRVWT